MPRLEGDTYFNNFEQGGYEEIKAWTPRYYQNIKEADANMQFAGSTIDLMAESLEKFCGNLFTKTMGEEALSRMEKFFYMKQNGLLDIDERRRLLAIAMAGSGKVSTTKIAELIRTYTGAEASFTFLHRLYIFIHVGEDNRIGSVETLKAALGAKIPAHVAYTTDYRTELDIVEQDLEKIRLHRIVNAFAIQYWHAKVLNGDWVLDGSLLLDSDIRHGTKLAIFVKLALKEDEGIYLQSSLIKGSIWTQEKLSCVENISACVQADNEAKAGVETAVDISMKGEEKIGDTIITKCSPGYWFLDGSMTLDGHKNMDSICEKEAVG